MCRSWEKGPAKPSRRNGDKANSSHQYQYERTTSNQCHGQKCQAGHKHADLCICLQWPNPGGGLLETRAIANKNLSQISDATSTICEQRASHRM
jgi:hypothetical protein